MNAAVTVFFLIIKVFSLYFLAVSLFGLCRRRTPEPAARLRRFAVLIAARNEESCIAGLIESLRAQHYPPELVDIWVLPNNCTDRTAEAARRAGAQVLEMPASVRSREPRCTLRQKRCCAARRIMMLFACLTRIMRRILRFCRK